jgi:hypothetical protein
LAERHGLEPLVRPHLQVGGDAALSLQSGQVVLCRGALAGDICGLRRVARARRHAEGGQLCLQAHQLRLRVHGEPIAAADHVGQPTLDIRPQILAQPRQLALDIVEIGREGGQVLLGPRGRVRDLRLHRPPAM